MGQGDPVKTSSDELTAFEVAIRDLVGVALRSVESSEVSLPQLRLLMALHEFGRSSSTVCAQVLGVAGSSVTRLADRLERSGHLTRGGDPSNRSVVTLELTDSGHRVVRQAATRRRLELGQVLDRLDAEQRASCAATLERVHQLLADPDTDEQQFRLPV